MSRRDDLDPRSPSPIIDPAVRALFDKLPRPGDEFPATARVRWLYCLAAIFDVVYEPDKSGEDIHIHSGACP